ncbi:hypothetical protein A0J61_11065, partial [Choanephora cucurbitarum]
MSSSTYQNSLQLPSSEKLFKCECSDCQLSLPLGYTYLKKRTYRIHQKRDSVKKPRTEVVRTSEADQSTASTYVGDSSEEVVGPSNDQPVAGNILAVTTASDECQSECTQSKYLPSTPIASLLFAMVLLLRKNQLSDLSCETVMAFCNMVLCLIEEDFRFPKSVATFDTWCELAQFASTSIKQYASCTTCHAIHPFDTAEEKQAIQQQPKCLDEGLFLNSSACQTSLLARNQYGTLAPVRTSFSNSLINTLKTFFMRDEFADRIQQWKQRQVLPDTLSDIYDGDVWKTFKLKKTDTQ